ncbi:MAG: hypothetical protein GXY19_12810 [Phycisphaerae bacterium]|jgi:hypothetical protein|nr:hypothetical protein [Phycisphaerae bacterium]
MILTDRLRALAICQSSARRTGGAQEILAFVCQSHLRQAELKRIIWVLPESWLSGIDMGRPRISNVVLLLLGATLLSGCAMQQPRGEVAETVEISGVRTAEAVDAATKVLRQMRFAVEKADAQAGVVRTLPLTGGQFFEFWRSDNADLSSSLEANLQTLRRSVLVEVAQVNGMLQMRCTIRVQRLSLPGNEVASVSQAYRIHSHSTRTTQRIDPDPTQKGDMSWIDLGDDPKLAAEILRKIAQHIGRPEKDETT